MPDEFIEVPETDALEQRLEVESDDEAVEVVTIAVEAPEADVLEQSEVVPAGDEYESR